MLESNCYDFDIARSEFEEIEWEGDRGITKCELNSSLGMRICWLERPRVQEPKFIVDCEGCGIKSGHFLIMKTILFLNNDLFIDRNKVWFLLKKRLEMKKMNLLFPRSLFRSDNSWTLFTYHAFCSFCASYHILC